MAEEKPKSSSISTPERECIMEEQRGVSEEARREGQMPSIIDKIMKDLTQPDISVFRVYGSNIKRKASVLAQINERVEREGLFDAVVMGSVKRNPCFRNIQVQLGDELGLQLNKIKTTNERAGRLCDKIKTHEKILIIIGDVVGEINLGMMGIPFGNHHMGCKILLLAHYEVESHEMKTQKEYFIDNEAGEFFIPDGNNGLRYIHLCVPELSGGGSKSNEVFSYTSKSTLNEMVIALTLPNMSIVGMYGSSNMRKREAVEQIKRRVERDRLFDVVLKATVVNKNTWWSKSPDVRRIQGELAKQLHLQLHDKTSLKERATRLCHTIKTKDNILIFLDHLQGSIDLVQIGIPFGNDHMGSKIVLVAQTREVLSKQMNPPQRQFSADD